MITFKKYLEEKLTLGRNETVHVSNTPIALENLKITPQSNTTTKPRGLWYGFGDDWIYFIKHQMPEDYWNEATGGNLYKVYIDKSNILSINSKDALYNLITKYYGPPLFGANRFDPYSQITEYEKISTGGPDWVKMSQDYDGIEIPDIRADYINSLKRLPEFSFLYPWDVNSGCIWNPRAILRLREL